MAYDDGRSQSDHPSRSPKPNWIARRINKAKSYRHERRANKDHESAADRASRSTAWATWAIAVLTIATIGVGVSQYIIFSRQLDEMRATRLSSDKSTADQIAVMQDQADAMQGQIALMRDAQRAWLKVVSITDADVRHGKNVPVAWFGIKTSYRNFGQTPAQKIVLNTHVFVIGAGPSPKATCEQEKTRAAGFSEDIVFPQDNGAEEISVQVLLDDLREQSAKIHAVQQSAPASLG